MHDAIVIGARAAGSTTAMLLARAGLDVLVVDRARFPSDTLSTHQLQVPAVARLHRWGLLGDVIASGAPATRRVRFDQPGVSLEGAWPEHEGVDALYSPRRTVLDTILVDAARDAGAEVREGFSVDGIVTSDGRVTGIRSRDRHEYAHLVIGADGRHSLLAKAVKPDAYNVKPALTCAYYTYWEGVDMHGGAMYGRPHRAIGAWPTNDGLTMTYVAAPIAEFAHARKDIEAHILNALDQAGDLGERVRAGRRAERLYGTADLASRFHVPYGPGWALVGDAGLTLDPVTGQGIGDAFRDAESLANAIIDGRPLHDYQRARDAATKPMYELTAQVASFQPPPPGFLEAIHDKPERITRFLGVLAGITPATPRNLGRIAGLRATLKMLKAQAQGSGARTRISSRNGTSTVRTSPPARYSTVSVRSDVSDPGS
jgi:flavin-dependent dehydrogenase